MIQMRQTCCMCRKPLYETEEEQRIGRLANAHIHILGLEELQNIVDNLDEQEDLEDQHIDAENGDWGQALEEGWMPVLNTHDPIFVELTEAQLRGLEDDDRYLYDHRDVDFEAMEGYEEGLDEYIQENVGMAMVQEIWFATNDYRVRLLRDME